MTQEEFPDRGIPARQADANLLERTRLLYASLPNALVVNAVLAFILAGAEIGAVNSARLWTWAGVMGAVLAARVLLAVAWESAGRVSAADASRWLLWFRGGALAMGAVWGLAGVLLFSPGNMAHQAYLTFVLAGVTAGAATSLAADGASVLGFLWLALVPCIVRLVIEDTDLAPGMGVMGALYLLAISANALRNRATLLENFRVRFRAQEREAVLLESEARLNRAQRNALIGNWELDIVHNKLSWSDEIYRMFEIDPTRFGASYEAFLNAIHPEDRALVNKAYADSLATHQPYDIVHRLRLSGGRVKFVHERCETEFDADGKPLRSVGTVQDITEHRYAQISLRESELRFRYMLETSPIAARITNSASGKVVFANRRYAVLINTTQEKTIGLNAAQFYASFEAYAGVLERLQRGEQVTNQLIELIIPAEPPVTKWVLASYLPLEYENEPAILGWFYDITDRKEMEEKIHHLAYHDPLTDLPNRTLFTDRLQQALAVARREKTRLAVLFVDLDRFKPINDHLGHNIGDLLLKQVARSIVMCLRESDTVGRIGGDEFLVLLPVVPAADEAVEVGEKIRAALNLPFDVGEYAGLRVSSSTGVAIYPDHGSDEKQLIKNADTAMYYGKSAGRNTVQLYRPDMTSE